MNEKRYRVVALGKPNEDRPEYIIRSDDKHLARLETFKIILSTVRYMDRRRKLDFNLGPEIAIPGDYEVKIMKKNWRKYGTYECWSYGYIREE